MYTKWSCHNNPLEALLVRPSSSRVFGAEQLAAQAAMRLCAAVATFNEPSFGDSPDASPPRSASATSNRCGDG